MIALRARLEAGELDEHEVRQTCAQAARSLLARHSRDLELIHVTRALASRGFLPAPPATLPTGSAAEVRRALASRSLEELEALAAAMVVTPDAAAEPEASLAALELLVMVPGETARAQTLAKALEAEGHDVSRQRFEMALRGLEGSSPAELDAWDEVLQQVSETHRATAERRAAARAIELLREAEPRIHGLEWLVPCRNGESIANWPLALARRPALATELGPVARWITAEDPVLGAVHEIDRSASGRADWEQGSAMLATLLDGEDRRRAIAARVELTAGAELRPTALDGDLERDELATRGGFAERLFALASGEPSAPIDDDADPLVLELFGDRRAAATAWLALGLGRDDTAALCRAVVLRDELDPSDRERLGEALATDAVRDETRYDDPETRRRAAALVALEPSPWLAVRLATVRAEAQAPAPTVDTTPEDDPHHPDNRLAAASDLLAADRLEPASNILAALVKKAGEHAPPRLFRVVTLALEADEPSTDLVHAVERALNEEHEVVALLEALRQSPSGAYALHEALIAFALDPSRSDAHRLSALEVWLGIWAATETPPDADAIGTLREDEPALLIAAALRLGGRPELGRLYAFIEEFPPDETDPEEFSDALLAAALGR